MGFFLGNGGIIKGEFTQSLYEVFDFLTNTVGEIFYPFLSMFSKADLREFKKSLLEGKFSSDPSTFSFGVDKLKTFQINSLFNFLVQDSDPKPIFDNAFEKFGAMQSPQSMDPLFTKRPKETLFQEVFQDVEKFYFINLFFLFSLTESLNFIFFGKQEKKKKFTQIKNSSYFFLPKRSFQKTQDQIFEQGALDQKTLNLKSDTHEFMSRNFGLWPDASAQNLFFQKNLILLNPLKLGFLFGVFVDAFKVGS